MAQAVAVEAGGAMDATTKAYLERVFERLRDQAVSSARMERERVMAQAASRGGLQSGITQAARNASSLAA